MPYKDPDKRAAYHREYYRPYMKKTRERDPKKFREYMAGWRLKKFGMTIEDYWAMLKAQDGRCAICGQYETMQRKATFEKDGSKITFMMAVDHDHQTNKVRALLCRGCNAGLGNFGDSIERLEAAIAYLREHKQQI